jgi:hypothetical protein
MEPTGEPPDAPRWTKTHLHMGSKHFRCHSTKTHKGLLHQLYFPIEFPLIEFYFPIEFYP